MTATGTAVVLRAHGGPDLLRVEQVDPPQPRPGQVLVEVEAAGVAYADVLMRRGIYPETPSLPFTPGYDVVGRVVAAGPGAEVALGTRVAALTVTGGYASHVVAEAALLAPVPEDLPAPALTALVLNYVTAHQMLHRVARVPSGGTVLVHGAAGGVGTALLELAAEHGVRAWGSASGERTAAVTERGAEAIDRRSHDVADELRRMHPSGVTATFDAVGGAHLRLSRRATHRRGKVVSYGVSFAVERDLERRAALRRHGAALARMALTPGPRPRLYVIAGRRGYATRRPGYFREDLGRVVELLRAGALRPDTTTLPLHEAGRAHTMLEAGSVTGKLVLIPGIST